MHVNYYSLLVEYNPFLMFTQVKSWFILTDSLKFDICKLLTNVLPQEVGSKFDNTRSIIMDHLQKGKHLISVSMKWYINIWNKQKTWLIYIVQ